jgi:hypothetical protein
VPLTNGDQQSNGAHDDVRFAIGKRILRARQGTLQQPLIAKRVRLARQRNNSSVDFCDCPYRQPMGLIWQVLSGFWRIGI